MTYLVPLSQKKCITNKTLWIIWKRGDKWAKQKLWAPNRRLGPLSLVRALYSLYS